MYGAILGDIIGSPYEFDRGNKTKDFPLFCKFSEFTDDTVMTIAVVDAFLPVQPDMEDDTIRQRVVTKMQKYGRLYPHAGYGGRFRHWLRDRHPKPYNSWGNGSAMRVSPCGLAAVTMDEALALARASACITHNHPEGIKGAQATAAAIWMARNCKSKEEIKAYIEQRFGYDLDTHTDEIRKVYGWEESCQGTVPPAIRAFLDSTDFESAVRIAVSLGGDSDTLACITGGIAEAYYGEIPREIFNAAMDKLPESFLYVLKVFEQGSFYGEKTARAEDECGLTSRRYTPENITSLAQNEVFVFGSNLQGSHGGGAAAAAVRYFGAVWGQGVGMQGQCYAIPTMHGGVDAIRPYVDEFIGYAKEHPEMTFLVTRIGCGIAGFRDEQMAPLFADAMELPNVVLPKSFVQVIK